MNQSVQDILAANPNVSIDELNRLIGQRVDRYNRAPQPDMAGLSPEQASRLLFGGWEGDPPAIGVGADLTASDLAGSDMLADARWMLGELLRHKGLKATAAGNLPRAFVRAALEGMRLSAARRQLVEDRSRPLNEADLRPLEVLRHVLLIAGLIRRTKGSFFVTRKGERLMTADLEADLFALLVHTVFRKTNLAASTWYLPEVPQFQDTIAFSIYATSILDDGWHVIPDTAAQLVLPVVRDLFGTAFQEEYLVPVVHLQYLVPMDRLGLVELDDDRWVLQRRAEPPRFRKTPLFDRAIRFDL